MPKPRTKSTPTKPRLSVQEQQREHARRSLRLAAKREAEIQRLTRRVMHSTRKADRALKVFADWVNEGRGLELDEPIAAAADHG